MYSLNKFIEELLFHNIEYRYSMQNMIDKKIIITNIS